jgi:hypothetical protein
MFTLRSKCASTHFSDSARESIFSGHGSLWDGDLQRHDHHAIHLRQLRCMICKLSSYSQVYNTNLVDRSHVVMPSSSTHVNVHNSYSSKDMSRWSNHNAYIIEHVSNIQNEFVPPYSSTEHASHCAPQTHMPMSNYYNRVDMRAPADFGQSLYTVPDSIRMEIAPNVVSSPHVASSAFHSASSVYSRIEESLANTPASSTNRSDIDKAIEDLPVEYHRKFGAISLKMEEAFMARYNVTSQGLVL